MVRDEVVIGSLRIPTRELQELLEYLEQQRQLGHEETAYCQHKVKTAVRQLQAVQRILRHEGWRETSPLVHLN